MHMYIIKCGTKVAGVFASPSLAARAMKQFGRFARIEIRIADIYRRGRSLYVAKSAMPVFSLDAPARKEPKMRYGQYRSRRS